MSTNVCTFCGRLGNNPEITILSSGKERVRFSIAVDRNYKRDDGTRPTDWISVVIWGSSAYVKKTNLHKGDKVVVSGRYEINEWTDNNGIKQFAGSLNCTNIELVEHKKSDKDKAVEDALANQNNPMNDDEDLPF